MLRFLRTSLNKKYFLRENDIFVTNWNNRLELPCIKMGSIPQLKVLDNFTGRGLHIGSTGVSNILWALETSPPGKIMSTPPSFK